MVIWRAQTLYREKGSGYLPIRELYSRNAIVVFAIINFHGRIAAAVCHRYHESVNLYSLLLARYKTEHLQCHTRFWWAGCKQTTFLRNYGEWDNSHNYRLMTRQTPCCTYSSKIFTTYGVCAHQTRGIRHGVVDHPGPTQYTGDYRGL
jgi:hypothetical protein